MIKFNQIVESILNEGRDAPLYHGVDMTKLLYILKHDKLFATNPHNLKIKNIKGVSTSRNYEMGLSYAESFGGVVFVLDQRKLAQRYKIVPISWAETIKSKGTNLDRDNMYSYGLEDLDEDEELILSDVKNLHKYILSINIPNYMIDDVDEKIKRALWDYGVKFSPRFNHNIPNKFKKDYDSEQEIQELLGDF